MERRAIVIRGIVQGVGFRPFVYNLATRFGLGGFVKNQTGSLWIEVEGEPSSLEPFLAELASNPPPLAQIEHLSWERRSPCGEQRFRIEPSGTDSSRPVFISPDVAPCPDCLAELFNPADRRYLYPFLNCTNCAGLRNRFLFAPFEAPAGRFPPARSHRLERAISICGRCSSRTWPLVAFHDTLVSVSASGVPRRLPMRVPDHPTLIRRQLQARLQRLPGTRPLLAGSLGLVYRACGTPSCRCHHGGPKHAAYQLTFKDQGRSCSLYVPKDLVKEVRQWLAAQDHLDHLLHEIHQLSRALIRTHVRSRQRQKGRP